MWDWAVKRYETHLDDKVHWWGNHTWEYASYVRSECICTIVYWKARDVDSKIVEMKTERVKVCVNF